MFGMLQYDSRKKEIRFAPQHDTYGIIHHSACDYCRDKKLRCSGHPTGCKRCEELSRTCSYTNTSCRTRPRNYRRIIKGLPASKLNERQQTPSPKARGTSIEVPHHDRSTLDDSSRLQTPDHIIIPQDSCSSLDLMPRSLELDNEMMNWGTGSNVSNLVDFDATPVDFQHVFPSQLLSDITGLPLTPPQSTPSSQSRLASPASEEERKCNCSNIIVFLIEDLDASLTSVLKSPLDASLAQQKRVLANARRILQCQDCTLRTETAILLLFICEKLINLSNSIVDLYCRQQNETELSKERNVERNHGIAIGQFEVMSHREWCCIMQALIVLQLECLDELLREQGSVLLLALPQSQCAKLQLYVEDVVILRRRMIT
ncbi:unnamed protein product [Periconia digitata]|uniref:Zn(2)-C6 fungal-type domain-containing protein n=1 Tax=Periconia digitata TaxID=1303443 RepID=A0A9W4UP74_9PLEO|nr:unnamed protein product [Periconia digitata]